LRQAESGREALSFINVLTVSDTMAEALEQLSLEQIRQKHWDEWVLVEVTQEDELNQPTAGLVLAHSKRRDDVYDELEVTTAEDPLVFFTGAIPDDLIIMY